MQRIAFQLRTKREMIEEYDAIQRWQRKMAPLFEPVPDLQADETLAMMREVFFMAGIVSDGERSLSEKNS